MEGVRVSLTPDERIIALSALGAISGRLPPVRERGDYSPTAYYELVGELRRSLSPAEAGLRKALSLSCMELDMVDEGLGVNRSRLMELRKSLKEEESELRELVWDLGSEPSDSDFLESIGSFGALYEEEMLAEVEVELAGVISDIETTGAFRNRISQIKEDAGCTMERILSEMRVPRRGSQIDEGEGTWI